MIRKELATAIGVAVLGSIIAFFICNLFNEDIADRSIKTVDSSNINADLAEPDAEIFNFRAINPTVEVYVGDR